MQCSFGYFDKNGTEFVVTEHDTPRALVNYFWNERFISGISHHGGGEGVYKERAMQYIDPSNRSLMVKDGHRYFYLRDEADGCVWSPGWHPVQTPLDSFECRHGLGYSIITSSKNGIESKMRVFVPKEQPCEVWTVTLTNNRSEAAALKFFSAVDWALTGYPRYCDYYGFLFGEYFDDLYAVQGCNRATERTHPVYDGFIASDVKPTGFDTSVKAFRGYFGHVNMPQAVKEGKCTNSLASCEYLCSAMEHTIQLAAGESRTINLLIGASSGYDMTKSIIGQLFINDAIGKEFESLLKRKKEMVDRVHIHTPDERVNFLINGWIKQQIQIYADVGSDNGRGFRDAMQLLWASASYDKEYTERMLVECLSHQYADGHTLRGWLPIDDHHYSDGPVWIPPVIDAYLKDSGDYAFLDRVVPFYPEGEGTVWEHVLRAMRHSSDDTGSHGLVLAHFGDWNDSLTGVGRRGKGETVWGTIALIYSLKIAADIANRVRQDNTESAELLARAERLTLAVNQHAWDGKWYLRAINDDGIKVGTHTEKEGFIYLLPQVWAVMAGIADDDREKQLFDSIDEHLQCDYGYLTLTPAYTKKNADIGRITELVPGMWENGSPYCHANGFKVIADCYGGRGDKAYENFRKTMPDSQWNPSTHSGCEPYVLTNQILGPSNRRAGETLWAWMTGTGAWFYRAMTEWMIGARADYAGLLIDPCLPSDWKECSLKRVFRGATYQVNVHNPEGLQKAGRLEITVDGQPLEGNCVPMFDAGTSHVVEVTLHTE